MKQIRIDKLLAERGLFDSRTSAAAHVRAGRVRVGKDGPKAIKPGQLVPPEVELLIDEGPRYVSRGGIKLANALDGLGIDVKGLHCLDVGASTGGFTDCLLQRGARSVIALDVAFGQLAWGLRQDERVRVIEGVNARDIDPLELPFEPSFATVDVSFISLKKVLPAVASCLPEDGQLLALVKPQFEGPREAVGKGGVVRSPSDRRVAILSVADAAREAGLVVGGVIPSGLPGPKGNIETFIWFGLRGKGLADLEETVRGLEV
jgi:23S rRNA (cytidine1920-2'-O)/16S rRNA (cytidine1409-2'-O)-methyltransferase